MQRSISVSITQKDAENKVIFSAKKEDRSYKGKIDSIGMSNFILNTAALNIQLAKLTGNKKQAPKLSQPMEIEFSINGKKSTLEVRLSLSEKRLEILKGKLPQIMLTMHRLDKYNFATKDLYVNPAGALVFADAVKASKKVVKELVKEVTVN